MSLIEDERRYNKLNSSFSMISTVSIVWGREIGYVESRDAVQRIHSNISRCI